MEIVISAVVAAVTGVMSSLATFLAAYAKLRRSIVKDKASMHDQVIEGYKALLTEFSTQLDNMRADHRAARTEFVRQMDKAHTEVNAEQAREREFFAAQLQGIASAYKSSLKETREGHQRESRAYSEAMAQFMAQNVQEHRGIIEMIEKLRVTVEEKRQ